MTSIELAPGDQLEGIELISLVLDRADAGSVRLERAHLESVDLGSSKLRGVKIIDTASTDLSASGGDWGGAQLRRATFKGGRLTGLSLGEARIEEVGFKDCKLDYANFRHSTIDHVTFDGCLMREADFGGQRSTRRGSPTVTLAVPTFPRPSWHRSTWPGLPSISPDRSSLCAARSSIPRS